MDNNLLRSVSLIKFGVREATAFIGHSFADTDREIVSQITGFLSKLGVSCDSGQRAEPMSVSEKVLQRILAAELFIGIFTRRDAQPDGSYTTSSWVIEEKAAAIHAGKRLLLFVEDGVEKHIGGLQGDYEYVKFDRADLADALIRAMDYVLAVTSVPLLCQVDYSTNSIRVNLGAPNVRLDAEIAQLKKQKELNPSDANVALRLAELLERNNQRQDAINELQGFVRKSPHIAEVHHRLAHLLENSGNLEEALLAHQNALDRGPNECKNNRCYGVCLYQKARAIADSTVRRSTLEKAKRLLQRAGVLGGQQNSKQVEADMFLVDEALADLEGAPNGQRDQKDAAATLPDETPAAAGKRNRSRRKGKEGGRR